MDSPNSEPDPRPDLQRPVAPTPNVFAGGAPLAFLIIGGTILGGVFAQPVIGFFAGTGAGILLAVAIWLAGRRK